MKITSTSVAVANTKSTSLEQVAKTNFGNATTNFSAVGAALSLAMIATLTIHSSKKQMSRMSLKSLKAFLRSMHFSKKSKKALGILMLLGILALITVGLMIAFPSASIIKIIAIILAPIILLMLIPKN